MITILILILLILLCACLYFIPVSNNESYSRGFPPIIKNFSESYYKVVTPLKPLVSPLKKFKKEGTLPSIYIYNPKYFSPVRDQGRCGGCWAFVVCSMLSDNVTIKILRFGKNLNVQQLLSCYPDANPCDGEAPEDALIWLAKTDFKLSIDNQYLQTATKCVKSDKGIQVEKNSIKSLCKYINRDSIENPTSEESQLLEENINTMKMQLLKGGPFFGSISVYQDFFGFKGDRVYTKGPGQFVGGHAITIVGWVDKGVDLRQGFTDAYWVCKNSWGVQWASGYDFPGFFAIKMGVNECGIEARSGCAEVNVDYRLADKNIPKYFAYNSYADLLKYVLKNTKNKN